MPRQSITFFPVSDLDATKRFYGEVLGFELALDQASCAIFKVGEAGFWGFCQSETPVQPNPKVMLTVVEDDVEAWHQRLAAAGVETDGPPRENPRYAIFHFFAQDPSGYTLEFQRFLDPRWKG